MTGDFLFAEMGQLDKVAEVDLSVGKYGTFWPNFGNILPKISGHTGPVAVSPIQVAGEFAVTALSDRNCFGRSKVAAV